jgi:hypothetical protein
MKILFADNWHFHRRNFLPIFEVIKKDSLPHLFETSRKAWWKAHGRYGNLTKALRQSTDFIDQQDDWREIHYFGINLWRISKAEFLCSALTQDRWHLGGVANQSDSVFGFALLTNQDREALRLCLAAAHNWLLFWNQYLDRHPDVSHAMVFSGSYIYTRTLMALAKQRNIDVLVAEHFFTGNDFYLEYRDKPIANNCGVQRGFAADSAATDEVSEVIASAYVDSRIKGMQNKNVPYRNIAFKHTWGNQNPIILIVGQVANDFSIIETPSDEISSIASYKQVIIDLLRNTNANVIFKAHPWERKRPPLFSPLTKTKIEEWTHSLPEEDRLRIAVIEDESIQDMFRICHGVMGISSQGLLEACHFGFKPALVGKTFFSHQGFTQDAHDRLNLLKGEFDKSKSRLSLDEYHQFQKFMKGMFSEVLIPNSEIASEFIREKLANPSAKPSAKRIWQGISTLKIDSLDLLKDVLERPHVWIRLSGIWIRSKTIT